MLIDTSATLEVNSLSVPFKVYRKDSPVKCPIPSTSKGSCCRRVAQAVPPVSAPLSIELTHL